MKNIWTIFSGDLKRLIKNPFALIIAIGLCVIPSLYAWFNIYANWDPYANTANIKIAAVSEDKGYTMQDGTQENMGDQVLDQVSLEDSQEGLLLDLNDKSVLYAKGAYEKVYPASITKIITALLAFKNGNMNDKVTITE